MLRFARPPIPTDPSFVKRVDDAKAQVESVVKSGGALDFDELPSLWGDYKDRFAAAQYFKCGYCESPCANHPGAVDHHAPKAAVEELLESGAEVKGSNRREGRRTTTKVRGYYWLAYDWNNWVFVCERCNSWKGCLFPVVFAGKTRALPPTAMSCQEETPLLLDPYGANDPLRHLVVDKQGFIAGMTPSGRETIVVCLLDRETLRAARATVLVHVHNYLRYFYWAYETRNWTRAAEFLRALISCGAPDQPYAGAARSYTQKEIGLAWEDLPKVYERIVSRATSEGAR